MREKIQRIPLWGKILAGVLSVLLVVCAGGYGIFHYYYHQMNIETGEEEVERGEEIFDEDESALDLKPIDPAAIQLDSAVQAKESSDVINILVCGEEAINDDRGRTDSIMIATINQKDNNLRLTSIMRDTYVSIPGFQVDGYVLVNFSSFQKIIDAIGGVDINLSEEEVKYLNRTNYISNRAYHNLHVGVNHMNGNQALGYARVRYVSKDGQYGDFARTLRHRTVMGAIYDKMMKKSTLDLVAMIPKILPLLTTNLKKQQIINYLAAGVAVRDKNNKLRTLNVPIDGCYKITRVRKMSVILASPMDRNVEKMHRFIFGTALEQEGNKKGANITVGQ